MASITIRNLDEKTKQALRETAARNGRSMEEQARLLLGAAQAENYPLNANDAQSMPGMSIDPFYPAAGKKILLIITGGIAAYINHSILFVALKERGVQVDVIMTKAAREFNTELSVGAA